MKFIDEKVPYEARPNAPEPQKPVGGDDSFDDDLVPNFNDLQNLPSQAHQAHAHGTPLEQARSAMQEYERHHKGYVIFISCK